MGPRLHGNDDGRRRAHPRRRGAGGDGSPSPRGRRWAAAGAPHIPTAAGAPTIVGGNPRAPISSFPRRRESMAGGRRGWVPVSTGTTMGGRAHPTIVIPATAGGRRWVPVSTGTTVAPISSFPRRRESTAGGGRGMGPRLHGDDGGRRRAHPTIVIALDGGNPRHPQSSFPRRRESMAGGRRGWVPVSPGTTMGGGRTPQSSLPSAAGIHGTHIVIPAEAGIHGGGPAGMGSRLHGNDGGRRNDGGRSSCPWRGSGGTLCCRPTCGAARSPSR